MSVSAAARILRMLWKAARAVRAVRRGQEFAQRMVRIASQMKDDIEADTGRDVASMSDAQLSEELAKRIAFADQQRRPLPRDFREGPDETTDAHRVR